MSTVWKYFKPDPENSARANCFSCKVGISRGGTLRRAFNTTNLIRQHPTEHAVYVTANNEVVRATGNMEEERENATRQRLSVPAQ